MLMIHLMKLMFEINRIFVKYLKLFGYFISSGNDDISFFYFLFFE